MSPDHVMILIVIGTVSWAFAKFLRSSIAEALARRIGGDSLSRVVQDGDVAELRTRLAELEERLDFTERVLLQERQAGELRQGGAT
jgi:hypothetical protein